MLLLRAFFIAVAVLLTSSLSAATLTVDLNGGADYTEIQPAIDAAADGDTVLVMPGEYVITEPINFNRLHDPEDPGSPPVKNIVVTAQAWSSKEDHLSGTSHPAQTEHSVGTLRGMPHGPLRVREKTPGN